MIAQHLFQVEELKSPEKMEESAPELAAKALDKELNGPSASAAPAQLAVNDLTGIVKKKKKAPEANGAGKRKADDEEALAPSPSEKKAKTES